MNNNADQNTFHAFTLKYVGITRQLITSVTIVSEGKSTTINALWDTGASGTCISHDVVAALALTPTGKMTVKTASGSEDVNTYLVDIILPNNVGIQGVPVCDSAIGEQGLGMLVGMDLIQMGDFSITNKNNTVFSFRTPSIQAIDYVEQANYIKLVGTHGKGKRKKK